MPPIRHPEFISGSRISWHKEQIQNAPHSSYEPPSVILNLFQELVFHSTKTDTETVMLNLFQYQYDSGECKDQILKPSC